MRKLAVLMIAALASFFSHTASAADVTLATVNAQPVKQAWLDIIRKDAQDSGKTIDDKLVLSNLIRNEVLFQEAIRLGLDKQQDFIEREEVRRREMLAGRLINEHIKKNPASEETLKAEYESFKSQMGDKEYSARHIQLQSEAEAREVIAQLAKGADFAKLAKEKSRDANTKDKGGLVGWFSKSGITPPLGVAASKLQKGLFTTVPLQSRAGWHVLKLEDVRDLQPPAYDKIKEQLRQRLASQQVNKLIEDLRAKAKIDIAK